MLAQKGFQNALKLLGRLLVHLVASVQREELAPLNAGSNPLRVRLGPEEVMRTVHDQHGSPHLRHVPLHTPLEVTAPPGPPATEDLRAHAWMVALHGAVKPLTVQELPIEDVKSSAVVRTVPRAMAHMWSLCAYACYAVRRGSCRHEGDGCSITMPHQRYRLEHTQGSQQCPELLHTILVVVRTPLLQRLRPAEAEPVVAQNPEAQRHQLPALLLPAAGGASPVVQEHNRS
mmetsp:Transcript_76251/g.215803  ORF Transcript_76251/g.215803 Transcript_76251/m.215803 type:complete len:231 (-) Transcript_76251:117-809(-)